MEKFDTRKLQRMGPAQNIPAGLLTRTRTVDDRIFFLGNQHRILCHVLRRNSRRPGNNLKECASRSSGCRTSKRSEPPDPKQVDCREPPPQCCAPPDSCASLTRFIRTSRKIPTPNPTTQMAIRSISTTSNSQYQISTYDLRTLRLIMAPPLLEEHHPLNGCLPLSLRG